MRMHHIHWGRTIVACVTAVSMAVSLGACGAAEGSKAAAGAGGVDYGTLVVDNQLNVVTIDPARSFETTTASILRAVYETALTFKGNDLAKLQPSVCTYEISDDNKVVTLTLNGDHYFADGKKVTVDDIVYSYERVQKIGGNPSFYLDGVTVAKKDDKSLTLTSQAPNPAIPYILPSVNLGIVEKSVVEANGGALSSSDAADKYLNKHSAGSGPYQLDSVAMDSQITLKRNDKYAGDKPAYDTVKFVNVAPTTELTNIKAGTADVALSVDVDEAASLGKDDGQVLTGTSGNTRFLYFNANPTYGKSASDPNFWRAVRHALDYKKYAAAYGTGSKQSFGIVPSSFLGALTSSDENTYDVAKAKEYLAKSSYDGSAIEFNYASDSDTAAQVAQLFQADMKAIGVTVKLVGKAGTARLDAERSGKSQSGLSMWGADYPDPSDYFVFTPDGTMAQRFGWLTSAGVGDAKVDGAVASKDAEAVMPYVKAAQDASGDEARGKAWQDLQKAMNEHSPIIPIVNDAGVIAVRNGIKGAYYDTLNTIDVTALR